MFQGDSRTSKILKTWVLCKSRNVVIDLDHCDIEWFALEMNRDHSVVFEMHLSTAFWTLVDYDSYSISSKRFLLTVVDIMVI